MKHKNLIFSNTILAYVVLVLFGFSFISFIMDDNLAIFAMTVIFTFLGVGISYIVNIGADKKNSIYIFLLFFAIYIGYNLIISLCLINFYGVENIKADELWFFRTSNAVYLLIKDGYSFSDIANIGEYGDTYGVAYWYGVITYIANLYGENSVLVQKFGVSFVAALIPMAMYGISRLYFSSKVSFQITLLYGFFSFIPYFASTLLRDTHIALMFILSMYLILKKVSLLNILLLSIFIFFSYTLREQTGVFMLGFVSIYFFVMIENTINSRAIKFSVYIMLLLILIAIVFSLDFLFDMLNQTSSSSAQRSQAGASAGSMGAKIAKLPFGLNILALFGFGQIQPFPPSFIFKGGHKGLLELTYLMAGILWIYGWVFLLYGIFKVKILKTLDLKLLLLFVFSMLYITLISVIDFSQRKQMAVYPIVFLLMVMSYLKIETSKRTIIWVGVTLFYITLVLTINYIKL